MSFSFFFSLHLHEDPKYLVKENLIQLETEIVSLKNNI